MLTSTSFICITEYHIYGECQLDILNIRLNGKVKDRLKKEAINKGITPSQYVRILIYKALKLKLGRD
jgi:hypothetical protein